MENKTPNQCDTDQTSMYNRGDKRVIRNDSLTSLVSADDFENKIITSEKFSNNTNTLNAIFLYTEEDTDLVKYVRRNYQSLDRLTGEWCNVYVLEKPSPSRESLRKYWQHILRANLYEKWSDCRWITNTKPFDKSESYKIARKIGISPTFFPCLVVLPPWNELSTEEKLIIPIEIVSKTYFRHLFSILEDIISNSEQECKYKPIKTNFKTIIQFLEKHSEKESKKAFNKYNINGKNILIDNKVSSLEMNQNTPNIDIRQSNIGSVTGEGRIKNAITHQKSSNLL